MHNTHTLLTALLFALVIPAFSQTSFWSPLDEGMLNQRSEQRWIVPEKYKVFSLETAAMRQTLREAPLRFNAEGKSKNIQLPMPDGSLEDFAIVESPLMESGLADKYPEIRTFTGKGITNSNAVAYLDWTPKGFHAMILMPGRVYFIDPYYNDDNKVYLSYDRSDYFDERVNEFSCGVKDEEETYYLPSEDMVLASNERTVTNMKTYRVAISATGEYTVYHGGTKVLALAAINTTLNRVRGIYETELAISFTLVSNNDAIIFTNGATDPFTTLSDTMNFNYNKTIIDSLVGLSNYDIGHLMGTGSGGIARINSVCSSAYKARGITASNNPKTDAFDVDFVAHEMGHQFGAHHTFNGSAGSCSGTNRYANTAYEPGSGSTIMAYAGICTAAQNLQRRTDAYFHLASLTEITYYTTSGTGSTCPTVVSSGNNAPTIDGDPQNMSGKYIPISTPFELTATGADADGDVVTYAWEQWNLGPQGAPSSSNTTAPLFRSFIPTTNSTRVFPSLSDILDNTTSIGEKLPTVTRDMAFNCTVRDNKTVGGGFANDGLSLHVTNAAGPFIITSHNSVAEVNGAITVTWNVAGTTASPISCANVDILLSLDGGATFTALASNTANDGTESVTLPNTASNNVRLKVKCSDNVFFDINNANLRITPTGSTCGENMTSGTMEANTGWTQSSTQGYAPFASNWSSYTGISAHGGTGYAWLGYANNETARMSQSVTIPSTANFASMEFWYRYSNTDCGGDAFNVKINGTIVKAYNFCNDHGSHDWTHQIIDLSAYTGTSPTIMFECINNSIYPSDVFIDDVSVYICTGGSFAPLPVELMTFEARAENKDAMLQWVTASEKENAGFEVEMQTGGADFQTVGFVKGNGTTNEIHVYDFKVPNLKPATYYFRLQQIDNNGEANYSPIRTIKIADDFKVSVQPNPASDVAFFIVVLEKDGAVSLDLLDGLGQVIKQMAQGEYVQGEYEIALDVKSLPAGVYYYRLQNGLESETGKFLVKK